MVAQGAAYGTTGGDRAGGGLKALLVAGLVALSLSFGAGLAVVGAGALAVGAAAGGLGIAYGVCGQVESALAADLDTDRAALRAADPAGLADRVASRRAAGALTAAAARRATDRAEAYVGCRATFAGLDGDWATR